MYANVIQCFVSNCKIYINISVIVKATNGPRYVVGCRRQLDKNKLKSGTRVALDMTTLTIMRYLPREVCYKSIQSEIALKLYLKVFAV